jgi:hypothetical protein
MITGMECIVKICTNVCCVVTALFDIDGSNPVLLLHSMCIKTIDFVKSLDFIQWHAIVHACFPQLPFIFSNKLLQVLSQLAIYSTNTVNINLVECGDNGANVSTVQLLKIAKLVARFFEQMENHILEGSYPDTVPAFTPRDANPNHKVPSVILATNVEERPSAEKTKTDVSPPGTPTCKRTSKRQKLKPGAGSKDFTKAGLFCCKEGTPIAELSPTNLLNKYCSFFCYHDKKCPKPKQSCNFEHVDKWGKIPANDQTKILEHCHASGGKIWLDVDTFAKHRVTNIPGKFAYFLGDAKGPKSA